MGQKIYKFLEYQVFYVILYKKFFENKLQKMWWKGLKTIENGLILEVNGIFFDYPLA